jgi:hypothetical protein
MGLGRLRNEGIPIPVGILKRRGWCLYNHLESGGRLSVYGSFVVTFSFWVFAFSRCGLGGGGKLGKERRRRRGLYTDLR